MAGVLFIMNAADFWTKVFKLKDTAGTEKFKIKKS